MTYPELTEQDVKYLKEVIAKLEARIKELESPSAAAARLGRIVTPNTQKASRANLDKANAALKAKRQKENKT